jgi:hypothetical protein
LERLTKSWTSQILGVKKNPMAPKSFYLIFYGFFYWLCSNFKGKETNKSNFFLEKICHLTFLKNCYKSYKGTFGGKMVQITMYKGEKMGFFKM